MKTALTARSLALLWLLFLLTQVSGAQELNLSEVPDSLPAAQREALADTRDELRSRWAAYLQKKLAVRQEFGGIREDDPRVPALRKRMAAIKAEGDGVVQDADAYHERVRALKSRSAIDARIAKAKEELRGSELAKALRAELEATTKRIEATKAQILSSGARLEGYPAAIEAWSSMTEKAQREAQHAAAEAVSTVLLERLALNNEKLIEKDVDLLTRVAKSYRSVLSARLAAPRVWDSLGRLQTNRDILALVGATKDVVFAGGQLHQGLDREQTISVLLKTLGMLNSVTLRDPRIALLIADGELVVADLYLGAVQVVACKRVNQILEVETAELKGLTSLTALYRADIDRRNRLRATLAGVK